MGTYGYSKGEPVPGGGRIYQRRNARAAESYKFLHLESGHCILYTATSTRDNVLYH